MTENEDQQEARELSPELADLISGSEVRDDGIIEGQSFRYRVVEYSVVEGRAMVEGDIDVGEPDDLKKAMQKLEEADTEEELHAAVVSDNNRLWPGGVLPYIVDNFDGAVDEMIDAAIREIEAKTSIRLIEHTSESDYVTFKSANYCSSSVGRRGGEQFIRLSPNASTGNIIHELCHAIGLWHEQSREDRDKFVRILWQNIQSGYEHNFRQRIADGDDVGPYDYQSIMHYPVNAFSRDDQPTIVPLVPSASIGQRRALSPCDTKAINMLYADMPAPWPVSVVQPPIEANRRMQFATEIGPRGESHVMTDGWTSSYAVHWELIPIEPASPKGFPQISWDVSVSNDGNGRRSYYFVVANLTDRPVTVEAWYSLMILRKE